MATVLQSAERTYFHWRVLWTVCCSLYQFLYLKNISSGNQKKMNADLLKRPVDFLFTMLFLIVVKYIWAKTRPQWCMCSHWWLLLVFLLMLVLRQRNTQWEWYHDREHLLDFFAGHWANSKLLVFIISFIPQFSYSHVTNRCLRLTQTVGMNSFSQPSLGRTSILQPLTTGFFVKSVCQDSVLFVLAPFLLPISHCSVPVVVRHLLLMCPVHCTVSSFHIYAKYTAFRVVP